MPKSELLIEYVENFVIFSSFDNTIEFTDDGEPKEPQYFDIIPDFIKFPKYRLKQKIKSQNLNFIASCSRFTFLTVVLAL